MAVLIYGSLCVIAMIYDVSFSFFLFWQLELGVHSAKYVNADGPKIATSSQPLQRVASSFEAALSNSPTESTRNANSKSDSSDASKAVSNRDGFFLLPDLNSLPSEDDSGFEMLYGMSG